MKRILCVALVFVFCFALVACTSGLEVFKEDLPGTWERYEETPSGTKVTLTFDNGTVTKATVTNGETETVSGTYTINDDGDVIMSFSNGESLTATAYNSADGGFFLWDIENDVQYTKVD